MRGDDDVITCGPSPAVCSPSRSSAQPCRRGSSASSGGGGAQHQLRRPCRPRRAVPPADGGTASPARREAASAAMRAAGWRPKAVDASTSCHSAASAAVVWSYHGTLPRAAASLDHRIVDSIGTEQNFPPLWFRQYSLFFWEKNHMGERRMPRRVQKHPQNCRGVST